jgi:uncharacterized repeat protein (TIGR01451 family)
MNMDHRLRILKSALIFLFLVGVLFAALALLPVMAQTPGAAPAAPFVPVTPGGGEISAQMVASSTTGYVIDNKGPGFTKSAGWTDWAGGGYGGDLIYTTPGSGTNWAQWRPDLYGGNYEVLVHYYADPNHYSKAQYTVYYYPGSSKTVAVNQQVKADGSPGPGDSGWLSLGEFRFWSGTSGYVRLTNASVAGATGSQVIADAVKFSPLVVWVDDDYCSGYSCINDGQSWGVTAFDNIQDALAAVGNKGTVNVKSGTYVGPITITKGITLTAAAGESPVITVTTDSAVQVLAENVTVRGFTVKSHNGSRGITNRDEAAATWEPVGGYRVLNNVIYSFDDGISFRNSKGEVSGNRVYSNTNHGIWIRGFPGSSPGGTTIVNNTLYGNGAGANDFDIEVQDSYTGTVVMSNTITGGGGASEACVYVLDQAGDLLLQGNTITGCWDGVRTEIKGTFDVQKVRFSRNVISAGTTGISVTNTGGTAAVPYILIGGSPADTNRIFGNSKHELWLTDYSGTTITATYNYWGVCNWRAIEDEIYHHYDSAGLSEVVYEPALCVPTSINVEARPTTIPGDGVSTATITATVTDIRGDPAPEGTMIGVTTTLGSVPYGYAEAEGAEVSTTGVWGGAGADARCSGGQYIGTADPAATMSWVFNGTAVSLIHLKDPGSQRADVLVDGSLIKTIDMHTSVVGDEWRVEEVITNALSATGTHTITVRIHTGDGGAIYLDAFRSGGTVQNNGRIVTSLTSVPISDTATVWGTVYDGRIYLGAAPYDILPLLTDNVDVAFQGADVEVTKAASGPQVSPGRNITYTITYVNHGPAQAKGVVVTDVLPLDFSYVSYRATPTLPPPTVTQGITCVWTVGQLAPRATGYITVVAQASASPAWPSTPVPRTNVAMISSLIYDDAATNNACGEAVDVVPNPAATIAVTAYPPAIPADGSSTSVITAEVRDMYNNPVLDGTAITFTTSLPGTVFQPGGTQTHLGTTTGGVATALLRAGTVAGHSTITVRVGNVQRTGDVQLLALEPYTVTISANPWAIPVSRGDQFSTLSITVTDQYRNLVHGAAVTLTTDAGALVVPGVVTGTEIVVTTTNGVATARLTSTESVMTATVTAAITTTGRPPATAQVYFMAALPYTITLDVYPTELVVCGQEAAITATIQDEFGNPVENGTAVYFDAIPSTAGELRYRSVLTVDGVATTTLVTKAYGPVPATLEVSVSAGRINRRFYLNLIAGPPASISFSMSPSAVPACGGIAEVQALVTDCAGNRVKNGTVITFSVGPLVASLVPQVTSTSNGFAYTVVRSGGLAGSTVLTATTGLITRTFTVVIDPGPADVIYMDISPSTISNCGGQAVVTATLRDACGNLVKDGTMVTFGPTYGYVSLSRSYGPTSHGVLTTTATANQQRPIAPTDWPLALEQIYAYSGSALQAFRNLWIRPGAPSQVAVSVDPDHIPILGDVNGYDIMVVANATDCSGTAVEDGTPVTLRTSKGYFRESGQFWVEQTTLGGLVTGTLTSREIAGDVFVTATAGSAVGAAQAYFEPDPPAYVEVWAIPAAIAADGRSHATVYVRIRDGFNNLVGPGITVTFTTARGHFQGDGNSCTTNTTLDGLASCVLVSDTTPGTVIVIAQTYNGVSGWFDLTFTVPHYVYVPIVSKRFIP